MFKKGLAKLTKNFFPSSKKDSLSGVSPVGEDELQSPTGRSGSISKRSDSYSKPTADLQWASSEVGKLKLNSVSSGQHPGPESPRAHQSSALPPVQISNNSSFTSKNESERAPPVAAALIAPSAGRRKSTPAALDMALRTEAGKAAVADLLNPSKQNKLVFNKYFAGTAAAHKEAMKREKAAAHAQAQAATGGQPGLSRFNNIPASPTSSQPLKPLQPPELTLPQQLGAMPMDIDRHMTPVPEDSDVSGATTPSSEPKLKKPATDSVSSLYQGQTQPATVPPSHAQSTAQPIQAEEVPPDGKRTKMIALSPSVPLGMQRKHWSLSDYNILRKMYTGYASTVYQAQCKKSGDMVALKVYHLENLCELNHYQVYREIRVHSTLQHQNIIHLMAAFQEGNDVVLVQEYAEGGDLYRLLHKNGGRLSERQAVEMVLHPFLLALHFLHTRGIMHRDIKPENVLFTEHRVLKLADFGLAIDLTEERAVTRAGTLDYMAPEVLRCPPKNLPQENKNNPYLHYNNSVDAWAVGVFAYELVVGFPPFAGETQLDSVDKIMHSVPEFPEKMSELAKDFITQALRKHPGDRPTVMEMLHHPWIRTYQRRTSVRIPTTTRRRSSVVYNMPGQAPIEIPEESETSSVQDLNEMTPEQIEEMIRRLQVVKQTALARDGSGVAGHMAPF